MKARLTVTLDPSVYEKLPRYGKSGEINHILKQHYQNEGFEQLYAKLKKRLLQDKDINDWIVFTIEEVR